jgi:hypothetical protein
VRSLCAILAALIALAACAIPVRTYPGDQAILVAPVGTSQAEADGTTTMNPGLPQPKAEHYTHREPDGDRVMTAALSLAGLVLGGTGVGAFALPLIAKAKTALRIASELADDCASAETDDQVAIAKNLAMAKQKHAGVHALTQSVRGKT